MNRKTRLSTYASVATTAAIGATMGSEATADTIVYDVGVTYGGNWTPGSGGASGASSIISTYGLLAMEPLGAQMLFLGNGFRSNWDYGSGSTGNFRGMAFGLGSGSNFSNTKKEPGDKGRLQVAFTKELGFGGKSKSAHIRGFGPGENVDSKAIFDQGGFAGASLAASSSGSTVYSSQKGLSQGQHFIGFRVVEDWEAEELTFNYGWVDLSFDFIAGTVTVNRWAYETDADTAASVPGDAPVPGAGGLIALALGAAGIRGRRRRVA